MPGVHYEAGIPSTHPWREAVLDKDLSTPPVSPTIGDRYIVAAGGTGAWLGHDTQLAEWAGSAWNFETPDDGWAVSVIDEDTFYGFSSSVWSTLAPGAHVHPTSDITSGTFLDARISQSSVTQHQAALSILASQIPALAASTLLGRGSAGGVGAGESITLGSGLTMTGTVLSASGGVGGSGTLNTIPKFTPDGTTLGNSIITESGTTISIAGSLSLTGSIATPTQISMSVLTVAPAHSEGLVFYIAGTDHTLCYYNDEADITHNIGQEFWIPARNITGATVLDSKIVYINGAVAQRPTVALASASNFTSCLSIGMATHDIENNSNGYITHLGTVRNINTSAFAEGDQVWVSTTAGEFTNVRPSAPNCQMRIGFVSRSHATQGAVFVVPENQTVSLEDTDGSHHLVFSAGSNLTANRTLTITTGDADRTLVMTGNATLNQDVSTTGTPTFAAVTLGTVTLDDATNGLHVHGANSGSDIKAMVHNSTTTDSSSASLSFSVSTAADSDTGRIRITRGVATADTTMTMSVRSGGVLTTAMTIAPSLAVTLPGALTANSVTSSSFVNGQVANFDAGAATQTDIDLLEGGVIRTRIRKTAGGNFGIESYSAVGALIDEPIAWVNTAGAVIDFSRDVTMALGKTIRFVAPSSNCPIRLSNTAAAARLAVCYPSLATNTAERSFHTTTPDADMTVTYNGSITFSTFAATLTDDTTAAAARTTLAAQVATQYQDEGVNQGTNGAITTVNFVGAGVSAVAAGTALTVTIAGGAGTPAGADTQVQFNNAGAFGASSNLTYDSTNSILVVTGAPSIIRAQRFEGTTSLVMEGDGSSGTIGSSVGNLSLSAATNIMEFNNSEFINVTHITTTGNTLLGNAAADTFKVHGASAQSGAQEALAAAAGGTYTATEQTLINALRTMAINHGLMAAS